MASISYWVLSPSFLLALWGKWKGWDRTEPTPAVDWKTVTVDVVIPAKNEESTIALTLASLFQQDYPIRNVTVIDDGSTDHTREVVERFRELSGRQIELVVREVSIGKTPSLRQQCRASDSDALMILDSDTVLVERNYLSRCVEELFKNAGVGAACGELIPWTRQRREEAAKADPVVSRIQSELGVSPVAKKGRWDAFLENCTIIYRKSLYLFLQRILYDGQLKMCGSQLNPVGCAVVYKTKRLRECFDYAEPLMGDNLSNSEDIFIGHFFSWKGYRNFQVMGVRCESKEPSVLRLHKQLYLWSSSFVQVLYYFRDLPLSPFRQVRNEAAGLLGVKDATPPKGHDERRRIQEQYRLPWGEGYTKRYGRLVGLVDLCSLFDKFVYPLVLLFLACFNQEAFFITLGLEVTLCAAGVFVVADTGTRWKSAGLMVAATPMRLISMGVDIVAAVRYVADMFTGNRRWRK